MPVDINNLRDGWLELESDPGLFTLLLENMGVKGVQVEEIYDLQKSFEGKVYGFIFLFKWIEERRSRRKIVENYDNYVRDENIVNNMFFAQQMVPNSCATHSLVSVLLNCSNMDLGPTLSRLKAYTQGMCPENKGWAIGNTPELAHVHNSHAAPHARRRQEKTQGGLPASSRVTSNLETFHFVSYVPVNGHLFELDGLKPHPLDHGPWAEGEDWTEKFRRVITERLGIATGGEPYHDIRFNLMAVVTDKIVAYRDKLDLLRKNRDTIVEALHIFIQDKYPEYIGKEPRQSLRIRGKNNNQSLLTVASSKSPILPSGTAESSTKEAEIKKESQESGPGRPPAASTEAKTKPSHRLASCSSSADYATPLTIETSHAMPATPSTDTASEAGSGFNSPQLYSESSTENSPAVGGSNYQRLVVVKMAAPGSGVTQAATTASCESQMAGTRVANSPVPPTVPKEETEPTPSLETNPVVSAPSNLEEKQECPLEEEAEVSTNKSSSTGGISTSDRQRACEISLLSLKELDEIGAKTGGTGFPGDSNQDSSSPPPEVAEEDLVKMANKDLSDAESFETLANGSFAPSDLMRLINILSSEIELCESLLKDELDKRKRYRIDDCRRTHNYDQFIITFLAMLAEQGRLGDLVKEQLQPARKRAAPHLISARARANIISTKKQEAKGGSNQGTRFPPTGSAVVGGGKKRGRKKAKGRRKR